MTKLLYIMLLIAAALFYPLYADKLSFILLAALMILPFILFIQLIISSAFLSCKAAKTSITLFKGDSGEFSLKLTNNSVFPLSNTKIRIKAQFSPFGGAEYRTVCIPLPALSSETVTVNLGTEHCGRADVTVEYVRIYDLLGLFSVKRFRKNIRAAVNIIPRINEVCFEEAINIIGMNARDSLENESPSKRGSSDPGDVCGFREFLPGDRLSLMHYKLSARFDKDIVKILGTSGRVSFLLFADLSCEELDKRDQVFERLMSIAYYMNRENIGVFTAVPENADCVDMIADGCPAAMLCDGADYFSIASALCGGTGSRFAAPYAAGLICVDLSEQT